MKKISLIIASLCLLIVACTPKITGLLSDPSFNTSTLYNGRMIVGGVTMAPSMGTLTDAQSDMFAGILSDRFLAKRKRLTVFPQTEIINVIGRARHNEILAEFAKTGQLSKASIADLAKTGKARYVVLARIDGDNITKNRTFYNATVDKNGNVTTPAHTVATVRRSTTTTLYVFDTQLGKAVWGGILTSSNISSKTYNHDNKFMNDLRKLQALTGGLDKALPYPPPPSMGQMCRTAFSGYAKNLPDLK